MKFPSFCIGCVRLANCKHTHVKGGKCAYRMEAKELREIKRREALSVRESRGMGQA